MGRDSVPTEAPLRSRFMKQAWQRREATRGSRQVSIASRKPPIHVAVRYVFRLKAIGILMPLLAACSGGSSGGGLALRSNTALLWEGKDTNWSSGVGPDAQNYEWIATRDVILEGQHLVVSLGPACNPCVNAGNALVLDSEDRGATYKRHEFPQLPSVLGLYYNPGVALVGSGAKLSAVATAIRDGAVARYSFEQIIDMDLTADTWVQSDLSTGPQLSLGAVALDGGDVGALSYEGTTSGAGTEHLDRYHVDTRTLETHDGQQGGPSCAAVNLMSRDGASWSAVCEVVTPPQYCRVTASSDLTVGGSCAAKQLFPSGVDVGKQLLTARGPMAFTTSGGRTQGVTVDPSTKKAVIVDFGPGALHVASWYSAHDRFGGLVRVDDGATLHFYDVTATGLDELIFPHTPCNSDDKCGSAHDVAWVQPLGNDDYLVFYDVNVHAGPDGAHWQLYQAQVHAHRQAPSFAPLTQSSPFPAYPTASPATELERACWRGVGCGLTYGFAGTSTPYTGMVATCAAQYWGWSHGDDATTDPKYDAFVQAASCSEIQQAWTSAPPAGAPPAGTYTKTCSTPNGQTCEGDLAIVCGADGKVSEELVCARQNVGCDPTYGTCYKKHDVACDSTTVQGCAGPYMLFCNSFGQLRYVDCTEAGFAGCTQVSVQDGHCSN